MRLTMTAIAFALIGTVASSDEVRAGDRPTFAALMADAANSKYMKDGIKLAKNYFKYQADVTNQKKGASSSKVETARQKWRAWIDGSKAALGIDLYAHPRIVMSILDEGRVAVISSMVKLKRNALDYGSKNAPGYSRGNIEYTVLVPKSYQPGRMDKAMPLVISMHGRAINLRHPSLKKAPNERSRIVLWNNWLGDRKTPPLAAVVLAPTGRPEGFSYLKDPDFVRQTLYLAMGVGHTDYHTDALGTFLEVYGDMIQVASMDSNLFAGTIWRDREGQQRVPVDEEHTMVFDNFNGQPLYYVADKKMWDKIGKPMSEALKAAYERVGKKDNLIVEIVERDANGALRADPVQMAKFLEHRLEMPQREFKRLFWNPRLVGPLPLLLTRADYGYDATEKIAAMPLRDRCGSIEFKVTIEMVKVPDGKPEEGQEQKFKEVPINLIDLKITEAQSAKIFLYENLVDLDLPITVKVNGNIVIENEMIKRNWSMFEQFCMPRRFFTFPIVGAIDIKFPVVPRVVPEPTEEDAAEGEDAETGSKDSTEDATGK